MNYLIWPEGQPEKSWSGTSYFKASIQLFICQMKQISKLGKARRMRWATSNDQIKADEIEQILRNSDAIAPPDGWNIEKKPLSNTPCDFRVQTLSVV